MVGCLKCILLSWGVRVLCRGALLHWFPANILGQNPPQDQNYLSELTDKVSNFLGAVQLRPDCSWSNHGQEHKICADHRRLCPINTTILIFSLQCTGEDREGRLLFISRDHHKHLPSLGTMSLSHTIHYTAHRHNSDDLTDIVKLRQGKDRLGKVTEKLTFA